jgi:hypothetical protein
MPTVAGFLRVDAQTERSAYPQVGSDSSDARLKAVYWRTAAVFFASSRRANPAARHVLFTNAEPPVVDGHDLTSFFRALDVELIDVPFAHRPPDGYHESWGTQFYVLDVLEWLARDPSAFPVVILDVDCVFVDAGDRLFAEIEQHGLLSYVVEEIDNDATYESNGLTKVQLQEISAEIWGHSFPAIRYCGGEVIGATSEVANLILAAAPRLWDACMSRFERGLSKLNTEEHFFSSLYAELELPVGTANGLLRRLWTQRRYRNTSPGDANLVVWHLPAEKKYGFRRLYPAALDRGSPFWSLALGHDFRRFVGTRVGVPEATVSKRARDGIVALRTRLGR